MARARGRECTLAAERIAESTDKEQFILTVTENGYGKRSSAYEYRRTNRGGQGITNIDTSERNGCVVACFPAQPGEQLMLVTDQGKMIRTTVGDIRIMGRNTQGVTIFRVAENEHVVSVAKIEESDEEEIELEGDDEIAPDEGATVGESELDKPADPEARVKARRPAANAPGRPRRSPSDMQRKVDAPSPQCAGPGRRRPQDAVLPQPRRREPDRSAHRGASTSAPTRKDRDIKPTRPGPIKQSVGFGRSTLRGNRFPPAGRGSLDQGRRRRTEQARVLRNDFEALAIVAPPKALGVLRKKLHKEVERRLVCTVNKEMSGRPIPDIEALLVGETQPERQCLPLPRLRHRAFRIARMRIGSGVLQLERRFTSRGEDAAWQILHCDGASNPADALAASCTSVRA